VPVKPYTINNCELDWPMQRHTTRADASLQALDETTIGRKVGVGTWDCTLRAQSNIYDCLVSERDTYVHVRYMLSSVRLSVICLSSVCNVGAPYSAG